MAIVAVTGAAGFIGSHTVDALLDGGHEVLGFDNLRTGSLRNLRAAMVRPGLSFREVDLSRPGALAKSIGHVHVDALIHLAGLVSVIESIENPGLNFDLNVKMTQFVAEAARVRRIPRLVFASSAAVYGDSKTLPLGEDAEKRPVSPYGAAKLASEALLLGQAATFGFTVRCQRYFNVFGARQDPSSPYSGVISVFQSAFREGRPVTIFGDGEQTRDFISVHDVARANVLAATKLGICSGVANICTGLPTSLNRLVEVLASRFPSAAPPIRAPGRPGDIRYSFGDPRRAREELGFIASRAVEEGLLWFSEPASP